MKDRGSIITQRPDDVPEAELGAFLAAHGLHVTTVESCTGGGIAQALTRIPGSSGWFEQGLVTYSNEAKSRLAGVDPGIIERYGAVSRETVCAMAQGGLTSSGADLAIAVSGIAGPGGGTPDKPVGSVWTAVAGRGVGTEAVLSRFDGDRDTVRARTVAFALELALKMARRMVVETGHKET